MDTNNSTPPRPSRSPSAGSGSPDFGYDTIVNEFSKRADHLRDLAQRKEKEAAEKLQALQILKQKTSALQDQEQRIEEQEKALEQQLQTVRATRQEKQRQRECIEKDVRVVEDQARQLSEVRSKVRRSLRDTVNLLSNVLGPESPGREPIADPPRVESPQPEPSHAGPSHAESPQRHVQQEQSELHDPSTESPPPPRRHIGATHSMAVQRKSDRVRRRRLGAPLPVPWKCQDQDTDASDGSDESDSELSTVGSMATPSPPTPPRRHQSPQPVVGPHSPMGKRLQKRRRNVVDDSDDEEEPNQSPPKRPRSDKRPERTIHWNELYGNGHPTYRHKIVEDLDNMKWYILRCDQCGLHFGQNPILQARGHLRNANHGIEKASRETIISELGVQVLDCTSSKKLINNKEFDKLVRTKSYAPFDAHRRRLVSKNMPPTVANPKPGELPLGELKPGELYCTNQKPQCVVMILPSLAGFDTVGVVGNAAKILGTPACYLQDRDSLKWAPEYEDGGHKVHLRQYPVMYFEARALIYVGGKVKPPKLDWKKAKCLRPFNWDDPQCQAARGYENAKSFFSSGAAPHTRNAWNAILTGPECTPPAPEASPDRAASQAVVASRAEAAPREETLQEQAREALQNPQDEVGLRDEPSLDESTVDELSDHSSVDEETPNETPQPDKAHPDETSASRTSPEVAQGERSLGGSTRVQASSTQSPQDQIIQDESREEVAGEDSGDLEEATEVNNEGAEVNNEEAEVNNEEVEENTHAAHRNSPHRGMADDLPADPGMITSATTTHDAVSNDSAAESPVTSQAESSQQARTPVPAVLPTKPKPGSSDAPIVIEDTPPFRPTRPMTPVSPMAFNTHLPTFGIDALTADSATLVAQSALAEYNRLGDHQYGGYANAGSSSITHMSFTPMPSWNYLDRGLSGSATSFGIARGNPFMGMASGGPSSPVVNPLASHVDNSRSLSISSLLEPRSSNRS